MYDQNGRVWSEEEVDIGPVRSQGGIGAHYDCKDHGRLVPNVSSRMHGENGCLRPPTLVCHIVIDVAVMVAKMWPLRATRKARMGSLTGILSGALAVDGCTVGLSA